MNKTLLITVFFIFASSKAFSQINSSFQINGGVIMPFNSSKGFTASVQYNYPLSSNVQLYAFTGYSAWDKHNINFHEDYSTVQQVTGFNSYSQDKHILIPVYAGVKIDLHTNKLFTSFISAETGYSYFSYNSYDNAKFTDGVTGAVTAYYAVENSRKENTENLFGIGLGTGISSPLTDNLALILALRLNTTYDNPFGTQSTYTALTAGINVGL